MSDVADRVKKIVVEHLGADEEKVVPAASFIDDLGADSLDTVELVMAFEEEFSIEIPDDAAETIQTWRCGWLHHKSYCLIAAIAKRFMRRRVPNGYAPFSF